MALQVWLPLNGNLDNLGLKNDITLTGTPSFTTGGKIADKCLNSPSITINNTGIDGSRIWSVCSWCYVIDSSITSDWTKVIILYDGGSNLRIEVCPKSSDKYCYSVHNNTSYSITTGAILTKNPSTGASYYNNWVHVCLTSDGTTIKEYINGTLSGSVSYNTAGTVSGGVLLDNNDKIKKNDFRIYDHCLSAKEVHEIAKGLMLHYKIDGVNDNLVQRSYDLTGWTIGNEWTSETDPNTGYKTISFSRSGATINQCNRAYGNKIYRSDIYNKGGVIVSFDFMCDDISKLDIKCVIARQSFLSNGTRVDWSEPNLDLSYIESGKWIRYSYYWSNASLDTHIEGDYDPNNISYYLFSWQLPRNGSIHVKNMKIELGNRATAWCPNRSDPEWTSLGYGDTTEYDHSGFKHDGLKVGDFYSTQNSHRYDSSYVFTNSCAQYIVHKGLLPLSGNFTISLWCYQTSATTISNGASATAEFLVSQGRDYMPSDTSSLGVSVFSNNGQLSLYAGSARYDTSVSLLNNWHMLTLVHNGDTVSLYDNGMLVLSKAISAITFENVADAFVVGKMSFGYSNATLSFPFVGNISDVRVYATALSEDDIKALYIDAGSVDKYGNIHAYSFKEI